MHNKELSDAYRDNYLESLRLELVESVEDYITPTALKYGYATSPLEEGIKWRPIVLLLGNYSSGKSTMINEFLGIELQTTGQAPTDDSFTVITNRDNDGDEIEERDGKVLLNDPQYPFGSLKKHGQRFAAHFRLKKMKSPFLKNLAIIDTPGMVDSVAERDRGYNYQEVIGDLASLSDLIIILFDPHKAGTIKETYESLRKTLPTSTYEDRVLFILNRIDECTNLNDLLRVYGTLCWNLSQMTGRKDIPMIHLTYSNHIVKDTTKREFLPLLINQRDQIKKSILMAPKFRLDHLVTYIEEHGSRLEHLLDALVRYGKKRRNFFFKMSLVGLLLSLIAAGTSNLILGNLELGLGFTHVGRMGIISAVALATLFIWLFITKIFLLKGFHEIQLLNIDKLTPLDWQSQKDSWNMIKPQLVAYLNKTKGNFSKGKVSNDYRNVKRSYKKSAREGRKALNELSRL